MSRKNRKNKQNATPNVAKARKTLTPKQGRFAAALMKASTKREAALIAGYSPKNPDQSANQAFNAILLKAPEAMGQAGLNMLAVIQNHLVPLLHAKEVKLAQHKGKYTDYVEVEAMGIRLGATNMAFKLLGAFKGAEESQEKKTVDCIIVDMPRPEWPEQTNVTPSNGNSPQKKEELENAKAPAAAPVKDPRPTD